MWTLPHVPYILNSVYKLSIHSSCLLFNCCNLWLSHIFWLIKLSGISNGCSKLLFFWHMKFWYLFFYFLFITTEKCVVEFRDFNISYCFWVLLEFRFIECIPLRWNGSLRACNCLCCHGFLLLLVMLQAYCGCRTDFKQKLQSGCNIFCINSHLFTMP